MEKFQITKSGFQRLKTELEDLKNVQRPNIINAIATARELGDLKENAEYHSAREKQSFIEAMIADFEDKSARAEIVDIATLSGSKVRFGATVELENLDSGKKFTYKIVSEFEANIDEGLISISSPVAKSLIAKEVGDEIEVKTPGGIVNYEILKVSFVA